MTEREALIERLHELGYREIREVGELGLCGIMRFLFTCGVCYGLDETGYAGRICFDTWQNAFMFLEEWDGVTLPKVGDDGCTAIK